MIDERVASQRSPADDPIIDDGGVFGENLAEPVEVTGVVTVCRPCRHLPRSYAFGRQLCRVVRVELGEGCAKAVGVEGGATEDETVVVESVSEKHLCLGAGAGEQRSQE